MSQKMVTVSDKSGIPIPEGKGAKVRITFPDSAEVRELDFTVEEAQEIGAGGTVKRRPGRPPGSKNKTTENGDNSNAS